jgi:hypothetical protein
MRKKATTTSILKQEAPVWRVHVTQWRESGLYFIPQGQDLYFATIQLI